MSAPLRVLALVGSPTNDFYRGLSELYAGDSLAALADSARYAFSIAHVAPDGGWRFPASLAPEALAAVPRRTLAEATARLAELAIDVALPQMFCLAGMTEMRALLDLLGVPYLGNRPLQMGLTANKAMAKAVVAAAGVDVPASRVLRRGETATVPLPAVVKPVDADNSDGVSLVRAEDDLPGALSAALEHSEFALVEDYVPLGREVRCGVIERGGELVCLPLEEYYVDEAARPVRRAVDKVRRDAAGGLELAAKTRSESWIVPADDPVVPAVWAAARRCYVALGCRHYGLFDFRIDPAGRPWFLEAGLYCSYAPKSVIVTMVEAAGTPLARFFAESIREIGKERTR